MICFEDGGGDSVEPVQADWDIDWDFDGPDGATGD